MDNENFRVLKPFLKEFPLVILCICIAVFFANKYLDYTTPMYESTAKLKIADVQEGVSSTSLYKDLDVFATSNKITTEIEVLKSTNLIEKALSKLPFSVEIYRKGNIKDDELFDNAPFKVEGTFSTNRYQDHPFGIKMESRTNYILTSPYFSKPLRGSFGSPISLNGGKMLITLNENALRNKQAKYFADSYEFQFLSKEKLLEKVSQNLDIIPVDKDVPIVRINYKSNVPKKAALLANTLAEAYIQDYIEGKYKAADTTVDFLNKEIAAANIRLTSAENQIQNFRDKNHIININQETETDLRKIAQLQVQRSNIKMNLDAVKNLNNYIASGKEDFPDLATNYQDFTDLLSTEMVKGMKKLQADKKELLLTYTPEHEKVKIIDSKIQDLADYQTESIKNTQKSIQTKYNDINRDIATAEQAFVGLPEKERILTILNREFNLYEKNYNFLNEKRIDAEIAKAAKISFHKVISPAVVPARPISPVRSIILIVAGIVGMLVAMLIIYLFHFTKARINDEYAIEKKSSIPVLVTLPIFKNKESQEKGFLQSVVELEIKGIFNEKNMVVITSYDVARDSRFFTANLFETLRGQGRRVLLIDVAGNMKDMYKDHYMDLSAERNHMKSQKELREFLRNLSKDYELCLINNQEVKDGVYSLLYMDAADQNLFVLDSGRTAERTISEVEIQKQKFQLPNLSFVLNRVGYNPGIFQRTINCFHFITK